MSLPSHVCRSLFYFVYCNPSIFSRELQSQLGVAVPVQHIPTTAGIVHLIVINSGSSFCVLSSIALHAAIIGSSMICWYHTLPIWALKSHPEWIHSRPVALLIQSLYAHHPAFWKMFKVGKHWAQGSPEEGSDSETHQMSQFWTDSRCVSVEKRPMSNWKTLIQTSSQVNRLTPSTWWGKKAKLLTPAQYSSTSFEKIPLNLVELISLLHSSWISFIDFCFIIWALTGKILARRRK